MPNEQLLSYVRTQRAQGIPDDAILTALRGAGWDESDISTGFAALSGAGPLPGAATLPSFSSPDTSASPLGVASDPGTLPATSASSFPVDEMSRGASPASGGRDKRAVLFLVAVGALILVILIAGFLMWMSRRTTTTTPTKTATTTTTTKPAQVVTTPVATTTFPTTTQPSVPVTPVTLPPLSSATTTTNTSATTTTDTSYANARVTARDTSRIASIDQIKTALDAYFNQHGSYPSTKDGLTALVTENFLAKIPPLPAGAGEETGGTSAYRYVGMKHSGSIFVSCTTKPCPGFALGVPLEDANNDALANDDDARVKAAFDGTTDTCDPGVVDAETCYDVSAMTK